ncbi:MAG TPA: hypothetical protein PKG67_15055, partial [Turneriella sp.]|nr:hypothetical protein [Turneriella sp.]
MSPVTMIAKTASKIGLWTALLSLAAAGLAATEEFDLTSDQLEQERGKSEPQIYGYMLDTMRQAEKPRFVTLIDAYQYARGNGLGSRGVLFSYHNRAAREVRFVADIPGFAPQAMRRNKYGVWIYYYIPPEIVHSAPTKKIRYKYWVDGLYTVDDTHEQHEKDSGGTMASVFHLLSDHFAASAGVFVLDTPVNHGREVLFRIPAGDAETASIAGDFNHWNPQRDFLTRSEDGYFELRKIIAP